MKYLSILLIAICATILPAQTRSPESVTTSAQISDTEQTISFRISWKEAPDIDSTIVAVFISSDTAPAILRRGRSPDTLTFTLPDDTTTYRFDLYSVRRGLVSLPANANFLFNADEYYKLAKLHIWPEEIVLRIGEQVELCAFLELNDGSILMRALDRNKPICVTRYNDYPANVKKGIGARQRTVNKICLEWDTITDNRPAASGKGHTVLLHTQETCPSTTSTIQDSRSEMPGANWRTFVIPSAEEKTIFVVVKENGTNAISNKIPVR